MAYSRQAKTGTLRYNGLVTEALVTEEMQA